jgi:hypothetical protein
MKAKSTATIATQAFRARQAALGGRQLATMLDRDAHEAIATIMYECMASKRTAIEMAVKNYAAELLAEKGK